MWKKIIEFKNAIIAVIFIAIVTLSASAYFVKASDFKEFKNEFYDYKLYQRLDYLDKKVLHYEMVHGCAEKGCMPPKMPTLTYERYDEILKEQSRLQDKLNINKQEDQTP